MKLSPNLSACIEMVILPSSQPVPLETFSRLSLYRKIYLSSTDVVVGKQRHRHRRYPWWMQLIKKVFAFY